MVGPGTDNGKRIKASRRDDAFWHERYRARRTSRRVQQGWHCQTGPNTSELIVLDHLKYQEQIKRYIAKHYGRRPIGYLEDFGGFLLVGSR